MSFIYKVTNDKNEKIYIGKTEHINPEDRWKEHLQDYKRERCEKRPLYEAMKKYGIEHFHFEVIEETDNSEEREKYWINELRTYIGFKDCNGYNATLGGDGKPYLNLDEKEVINYHINNAFYITQKTAKFFNVDPVTIKKILNKHNVLYLKGYDGRKMLNYIECGEIFQVDIKNKLIINIFTNTNEVLKHIGNDKNEKHIINACNGMRGSHYAYGYLWYRCKNLPQEIWDKQYFY